MRKEAENWVAYLKANRGYHRAMEELRKKWRSYGRAAGRISLKHPEAEELSCLSGLLGRRLEPEEASFTAREFEAALAESRFGAVDLGELLAAYFGGPVATRQEEQRKKEEEGLAFFSELRDRADHILPGYGEPGRWIRAAFQEKKYGYRLMAEENRGQSVTAVCQGLAFLEKRRRAGQGAVRLAVLGAGVTGNPHCFDRNTGAGRLLLSALSFLKGREVPQSSEQILELYYESGIQPDDLSSFTAACGIALDTEEGEHKAYRAFCERGEPYLLSLANLAAMTGARARGPAVFAVENQMVFSHLCGIFGKTASLICTSGQMKTASLILIDLLCRSGVQLFYSGDMDPEGLGMADRLLSRWPEQVKLWHFTPEDYKKAMSEEPVSGERLSQLDKLRAGELKSLGEELKRRKKAGYQEGILGELEEDIRANTTGP